MQDAEAEIERLMNQSVDETPEMLELTMVSNESDAVILKSLVIAECLLKRTNDVRAIFSLYVSFQRQYLTCLLVVAC